MPTLDADDAYAAALSETARLLREEALLNEALADLTGENAEPGHPGYVELPDRSEHLGFAGFAAIGSRPPRADP
ncbi:hypothetical protein [Actinomadura oligospora]|uniref:hypothetical protein n=1 Tax=Actinomadura oligospora TaxID=111804 RepID=UPI00047A7C3F|nr:hypothetical protein [Actinomadura oligospora]